MRSAIKHWCWAISLLLSLSAIGAIAYKWWDVVQVTRSEEEGAIASHAQLLGKVLRVKDTIEFQDNNTPTIVPTGLFIQSLRFKNSSDVNVTGYIWQKFQNDIPESQCKREFLFAEEVDSASTKIELIEEVEVDGIVSKCWYFDVTVRQSFDYSNYPLDHHAVWLRIWPKDFANDSKILLIPDFESYLKYKKADHLEGLPELFGLDVDLVPGEWKVYETFFSYKNIPYDTDFGLMETVQEPVYKEFFFNVSMRRKFINPFMVNLVPLFIVSMLLYFQVLIVTDHKRRTERFGFNTTVVISTCSALFFVAILAHVQVRSQFAGTSLVYIEYFYLIMYLYILLTALNAYAFSFEEPKRLKIFHYGDNLIPKVCFWPLLLWSMAVVSYLKL